MRQEPCTQRAFFGGLKVEFSRGCDWDGVMDGKFPGTLGSRALFSSTAISVSLPPGRAVALPPSPPSRGQGPGALVGVHGLVPSQAAPRRSGVKGGPRRPPPFRRNCAGSRGPPLRRGAKAQPGAPARRVSRQKERRRRRHHRRRRRAAARTRRSSAGLELVPTDSPEKQPAAPLWEVNAPWRAGARARTACAALPARVEGCLCPDSDGIMRLSRHGPGGPTGRHRSGWQRRSGRSAGWARSTAA